MGRETRWTIVGLWVLQTCSPGWGLFGSGCGDDTSFEEDSRDAAQRDGSSSDGARRDGGPRRDGSQSDGAISEPTPTAEPNDSVIGTLDKLGIDTDIKPPLDENGDPLPDDYSPLGPTVVLDQRDELFIGGLPPVAEAIFEVSDSETPDPDQRDVKHELGSSWVEFDGIPQRAVASGDFDGDGFDELAQVYIEDFESATLMVSMVDDAASEFATEQWEIAHREGVLGIQLVVGDFDGDGTDSLAVALELGPTAELLILDTPEQQFAVVETLDFQASAAESNQVTLALAAGNLDYDGGDELAVVINEGIAAEPSPVLGPTTALLASYTVLDDANRGFAVLASDFVQGIDNGLHSALVADVAIGDIDADGLDEVVFGGLTEDEVAIGAWFECGSYETLLIALDDASPAHQLVRLDAKWLTGSFGNQCSAARGGVNFVHVEIGNLDGDPGEEIVVGPLILDDWSSPWSHLASLPSEYFGGGPLLTMPVTPPFDDRRNSAVALADMDGDGAEEIYLARMENAEVTGYTLSGTSAVPSWRTAARSLARPLLVPANVDEDGFVAKFVEHQSVLTEPIIIAALAAAPCNSQISQQLDACTTAFGVSESAGLELEQTVTARVKGSLGVNAEGGVLTQSEVKTTHSLEVALSYVHAYSTSVEKSVTFSAGSLEDAVLFSSIPMDVYTYKIIRHNDELLRNTLTQVRMPQAPSIQLVERSYFNSVQPDSAMLIDDALFSHTIGDPNSYPSSNDKRALSDAREGKILENGPAPVGQGRGATEVSIDVSEERSNGGALEVAYTYAFETTIATLLVGVEVGASVEAGFSWSTSNSSSYVGSVGNIEDPDEFAAHGYSFGLFSYVHEHSSGRQFEVLNYWVE